MSTSQHYFHHKYLQRSPVRQPLHQHHYWTLCTERTLLQPPRDPLHHPALCLHGQPLPPHPGQSSQDAAGGQGGAAEDRGWGEQEEC